MQDLILSLDVGTTVVKCVLFDTLGNEIGVAEKGCRLITPLPGFVEQDPEEVWSAVIATLKKSSEILDDNQFISAITIATQGGSVIPVNHLGEPANKIITWMDNRAQRLVEQWLKDGRGELVRKISGWHPEAGLPAPVIGWFHENNKDVFSRSAKWLSVNDFLVYRLTGEYVTNPSMAGEMLLTDIGNGTWNDELCEMVGIKSHQLSTILPSTDVVGKVKKEISELTGLTTGIPVINGGQDHACEAYALGITSQDKTFLACGTAWVINGISDHGNVDLVPKTMNLNFHVKTGLWMVSQFLGGLGSYPEWCVNQMWKAGGSDKNRADLFQEMNLALSESRLLDDRLLFIPLAGSYQLVNHPQSGGFLGLRIDHTRTDMSRAILESAAFEVKWALEGLKKERGDIHEMWMIGGATRSPLWPQILADITGVNVFLTSYSHSPALGAAMLACLGLGIYKDEGECNSHFIINSRQVNPNFGLSDLYQRKFEYYKKIVAGYAEFFESTLK